MDGQNLTSQNAPGSTIGNLGGVLTPPRMPIFAFIGQPPSRRVSKVKQRVSVVIATRECHCEGVKRPKQSKYEIASLRSQ